MKTPPLLVSLLFLAVPVVAQIQTAATLRTVQDVIAHTDAIMKLLSAEQVEQAVELEMAFDVHALTPEKKQSQISDMTGTLKQIYQLFGSSKEVDRVAVEQLGDSLLRVHYVQKLATNFVYWRFTFYKAERDWRSDGMFMNANGDNQKTLEAVPAQIWKKL